MTRFGCQTLPNSISGAEDQPLSCFISHSPQYWFHGVFLRKFKMDISSKFLQRIEDQLLIVTITVKFTPQKFNIATKNDALENVCIYIYMIIYTYIILYIYFLYPHPKKN